MTRLKPPKREIPDHIGCKGVLVKEHIGVGKISIRCSYCKHTLTQEELKKHNVKGFYGKPSKRPLRFNEE